MEKPPAFQLYARDIYTGCSDMSGDEFGAYVRAMCWSWDNGPLPLDLSRVARLMLVERADFDRIWEIVGPNWQRTSQGFVNDRLEAQREELMAFRAQCSQAGIKSGESRRRKRTDVRTDVATDLRTGSPTEREPEGQRNANTPISDLLSPSSSAPSDSKQTICSEPAQSAVSEPNETSVLTFATIGPGAKSWHLTLSQVRAWEQAYPGVNVMAECLKALVWIDANPEKRKTHRGMAKFLVGWISRAVDSGRAAKVSGLPRPQPAADPDWFDECTRLHSGACGGRFKHGLRMAREIAGFIGEKKVTA